MCAPMEESSNLKFKAKELLATQNPKELSILVDHLFLPQETIEYQTALTLYDFCIANFPNSLTLMLLKVYLSDGDFRFRSIDLLSVAINNFRNLRFNLSLSTLDDIKPLLISCLTVKEPKEFDINLLRRILSFVAYNVLKLQNQQWEELSDCILSLAEIKPLKAFHFFIDLPPVYENFISKFMQKLTEEAEKVLQNPNQERIEDWSLALQTIVKLGIQGIHTEMSFDKIKNLRDILVNSAKKVIEKGMEQFLLLGLEYLEKFLSKDKYLYDYSTDQCRFVSSSMDMIQELGTSTKAVTTKINLLVKYSHNPFIKLSEGQVSLTIICSLAILREFALTDIEETYGEIALKRLNVILSDDKGKVDISVIRALQPLLITCLMKESISDTVFKLLGEAIYLVSKEINETWDGLQEYIVSHTRTHFQKAIYIFQCLAIPLKEEFLSPIMEILLPHLIKKLTPLEDNNDWVSAFVGALCTIIHLLGISSYVEYAEEIAYKMVESVKEVVESDLEVVMVFREVEDIVIKYLEMFGENEYGFVKGLIGRLFGIDGMSEESKIVLWRICVILKGGRGVVGYWRKQDLDF